MPSFNVVVLGIYQKKLIYNQSTKTSIYLVLDQFGIQFDLSKIGSKRNSNQVRIENYKLWKLEIEDLINVFY